MEKEIFTKQELVEKAVNSCKAVIRGMVFCQGYMSMEEYERLAVIEINGLYTLDIISCHEFDDLRRKMFAYFEKQNALGSDMVYK